MMRVFVWRRPGRVLVTAVLAVTTCTMLLATLCCNLPQYSNRHLPLLNAKHPRYQSAPWGNSLRLQAMVPRDGGHLPRSGGHIPRGEPNLPPGHNDIQPGGKGSRDGGEDERHLVNDSDNRRQLPIFNYKREEIFHDDVEGDYPLQRRTDMEGQLVMKFDIQQQDRNERLAQIVDDTDGDELYEYEEDKLEVEEEEEEEDEGEDYDSEEYDYDDDPKNSVFKSGDFDMTNYTKLLFKFRNEEKRILKEKKEEEEEASDYDEDDYNDADREEVRRVVQENIEEQEGQDEVHEGQHEVDEGLHEIDEGQHEVIEGRPGVDEGEDEEYDDPPPQAVHGVHDPRPRGAARDDEEPQNRDPHLRDPTPQHATTPKNHSSDYKNKILAARTLKNGGAESEESILAGKIETQIPLQDGVDSNMLGVEQPATQIQMPLLLWQPGEVRSRTGVPLVVNKIYWSRAVEELVPKGNGDKEIENFLYSIATSPVKILEDSAWDKCGRPKNKFLTLTNGLSLCARYRDPDNKLIQGEILTFHLSRMLGMDNVPVVTLSQLNSTSPQWAGTNYKQRGWQEGRVVALIEWIGHLDNRQSRVKMPRELLEAIEKRRPFDWRHPVIANLSADELTQLIQWGDMLLLDYITGHYDRVASMQDGADRESKPSILQENIRNLRKWQTGKLWLIDNESGLLDSYSLLYMLRHHDDKRFVSFHEQMISTMCIFRNRTIAKISQLAAMDTPDKALVDYTTEQEPLFRLLPLTKDYDLFTKYFRTRLKRVLDWVRSCGNR